MKCRSRSVSLFPRKKRSCARRDIDIAGRIEGDVVGRRDLRAEDVDVGLARLECHIRSGRQHRCHVELGGLLTAVLLTAVDRNKPTAAADAEAGFLALLLKLVRLLRSDDGDTVALDGNRAVRICRGASDHRRAAGIQFDIAGCAKLGGDRRLIVALVAGRALGQEAAARALVVLGTGVLAGGDDQVTLGGDVQIGIMVLVAASIFEAEMTVSLPEVMSTPPPPDMAERRPSSFPDGWSSSRFRRGTRP